MPEEPGGVLVPLPKGGGIVPTREELIKQIIYWIAKEYGVRVVESMFDKVDTSKLVEMWKERRKKKPKPKKQKQLPSRTTKGGGGALVLLVLLALGGRRR